MVGILSDIPVCRKGSHEDLIAMTCTSSLLKLQLRRVQFRSSTLSSGKDMQIST